VLRELKTTVVVFARCVTNFRLFILLGHKVSHSRRDIL
jgi:hypothetical protein